MNLELRPVESREEARALAPRLGAGVAASTAAFREEDSAPDAAEAFLERHFDAHETLLVVAEAEEEGGEVVAFCLTGPLEDPWTAERVPLVVGLWVRPNLRHRGVARALVREARRLLARRGLSTLAARTGHNDDAVLSMGERWGFIRSWEYLEADA